jgi:hypothetical protein
LALLLPGSIQADRIIVFSSSFMTMLAGFPSSLQLGKAAIMATELRPCAFRNFTMSLKVASGPIA